MITSTLNSHVKEEKADKMPIRSKFIVALSVATLPLPLTGAAWGLEPSPVLVEQHKLDDNNYCGKFSDRYECAFERLEGDMHTFSNEKHARAIDGVFVDFHVNIPNSCSNTYPLIDFWVGPGATDPNANNNPLGRSTWAVSWHCRLEKLVIRTADDFSSTTWSKAPSHSGLRSTPLMTVWPLFSTENLKGQKINLKVYVSRANSYIEVTSKHRFHHTHKRVQQVNWIGYGNTIGYAIENSPVNDPGYIWIRRDGDHREDNWALFGFSTSPEDPLQNGKGYFRNAPLADQLFQYGQLASGSPADGNPYTKITKRKDAPLMGYPQRAKGVLSVTTPK